jgi:hypothetical protein
MTQESLFPMPQTERTSNDYWTPKWIFDALNIEFDLDVACPPEGPMYTPAKKWYTQETDGLSSPWFGRVWMNPPFSKAKPWADKFINHGNGICLMAFSKSYWFEQMWNEAPAICLPPIHMEFVQGGIFIPVFMAAFGDDCVEALKTSELGKMR